MKNIKTNFLIQYLITLLCVLFVSSCLDSKVLIDFKNSTIKKLTLSSYYSEKIQLEKTFGIAGEFDINSLKNLTIFSTHDFFIKNALAHEERKFLFEITHNYNEPASTIVRLDEFGNYDSMFAPIFANQGVEHAKELKILKVNEDGSFFVTTPGILESCHNAEFNLGDCHTLKKYLANGKLDISFGKNGIIDLPTPLTSNPSSYSPRNSIGYMKELPNSKLLVGGKINQGGIYKFFFSILNIDGSVSQDVFTPDSLNIGQTEIIADVTIGPDSKWIITSYKFVQNVIYNRILNSDLSADNLINSGTGYFSTPTTRSHIAKHLVVDNVIFFISTSTNPNIPYTTIGTNNHSTVSKYNIETRSISQTNIIHPTIVNNGLLAYNMSYVKDDDNLFIFSFANFNLPELKRVVYNFEASTLTLKNSFGSNGSFVSSEGYPRINPLYSFGIANQNYIYSFSQVHIFTRQTTIEDSVSHFKLTIEDSSGVAASNSHIPINGRAVKLKFPFQISSSLSKVEKRYLSQSGNLYILFSNGIYHFKENSNFLIKISSNGQLDQNFGVGGVLNINNGIVLKMTDDKDDFLNIFYLKDKPPFSDQYDIYVQKINNKGENILSFGSNGSLLIGSNPITSGQVLLTSSLEHYYSRNVTTSINDDIYKIGFNSSLDVFAFLIHDMKANTFTNKSIDFADLKNTMSTTYNPATLNLMIFEFSLEKDNLYVAFVGNKTGVSNKDFGVVKIDMTGSLVADFGNQGISAIGVDKPIASIFLKQIDGKIQVIAPYQSIVDNNIYINTYLQVIDSKTGILENNISEIETDDDVLLINNSFASSKNEICFMGVQAKTFSLSAPLSELKLESFLSYLEFKNGIYTYKKMNLAGIDLFENATIEQVSYRKEGFYLLLSKLDPITLASKPIFTKIVSN